MTVPTAKRQSSIRDIPRGMWGMMVVVPAIFLLTAGINAWIAAAQNRAPTIVSYEEFARLQPKSGWYTITGGIVDATNAVYDEQNGVCIYVYAPLRSVQTSFARGSGADIYVEMNDGTTLTAFQERKYARHDSGESGEAQYIAAHRDVFEQRRDVSGLVSYGRRDPIGEWSQAGLDASNITFIADGWKPNYLYAYGGTGSGLAFTLLSLWLMASDFLRKRS